jgi:hypothetical protein
MNNEHMVEAHNGLAVLDDVEADTFVGFCEFAYTGDYRSRITEQEPEVVTDDPAPIQREEAPEDTALGWEEPSALVMGEAPAAEAPVEEVLAEDAPVAEAPAEEAPAEWGGYWGRGRPEKKKYRTQATQIERIWKDFLNLTYEDPPCLVSDEQATLVNGDNASVHQTTISLLYHAKIYVFAEKYLIDNLRVLCLRKLHAALRDFDLTSQTSGLILEVLEFAYAQTERKESRDDELRMLLIHYAACKGKILKQNPSLRSLLEANGEMACDLLYKQWGDSI